MIKNTSTHPGSFSPPIAPFPGLTSNLIAENGTLIFGYGDFRP
jgi:hypothetical protein